MPVPLLTRFIKRGRLSKLGARTRRVLPAVFFALFFVLGFAYHLFIWFTQEAPSPGLWIVYNLVVAGGYTSLWALLSHAFRERRAAPAKIYWTTLVLGAFLFAVAAAISLIGPTTGGFDYEKDIPLTWATVVKMNVLSLLEISFFFILLRRFRDLVLFKRTKSSQRNWYLMLGFMVLAALTVVIQPPESPTDLGPLTVVFLIPAVVFMVINSFRLSWIVHLSLKEKMAISGLSLLLLVGLVSGMPSIRVAIFPSMADYLSYYSLPLATFSLQATIFGILYCTTALLSLLFHLPTTSDFQRKAHEISVMHSLTHLVNQVFDLEKLVASITASPVEAGSADSAWLAVADPESGSLRPRLIATHNIMPSVVSELVDTPAFYEEVLATHEPLLVSQALADHRIEARPGDSINSLLVIPLIARDEMLGTLFVGREVMHGFEQDDIEAISVFAAQAALALDNARLFEERIERERLSRELAIAREVQHKLLPQTLPTLDGVTLCASSVSAQEVGGDYYDFARIDEQHLAFIIGDVSGKGTSAAFYMAEMQGIFQAVSHLAPDPRDFLIHANRALASALEKNVFISVIYGILDLEREEVRLARAGHCPAAVINLTGEARYLRSQGLGLGLDRGPLFAQTLAVEHVNLQPGDVLVLYTDGVVESRAPDGEEYGYDRLLDALRTHRHEDATDLHTALLDDLNTFLGGMSQYDDDMTLMVLKWHGITLPGPAAAPEPLEEKTPASLMPLE